MTLDCILIGHSVEPIDRHLEIARAAKDVSAGYQHILANSARFKGKRGHYFDALNRARTQATGKPSDLHFAWIPNVAAYLLSSFLERHGMNTAIINYFDQQRAELKSLLAERPKLVAITTTFYIDNEPIKRIVRFVRAHSTDVKIVVGGPRMFHIFHDYATIAWRSQLSDLGADIYVNDSQGELTLLRLAVELRKAVPDLEAIPNLVYLRDARLRSRHDTPRIITWTSSASTGSSYLAVIQQRQFQLARRVAVRSVVRSVVTRSSLAILTSWM